MGRLDYAAVQLKAAVVMLPKAIELDPTFMKAFDNLA
jgi:hypothetical protein